MGTNERYESRIDNRSNKSVSYTHLDANELNQYYRKLIDIQGVSKNQINKIFSSVYEKDIQFAKELKKIDESINAINSSLNEIIQSFKFQILYFLKNKYLNNLVNNVEY